MSGAKHEIAAETFSSSVNGLRTGCRSLAVWFEFVLTCKVPVHHQVQHFAADLPLNFLVKESRTLPTKLANSSLFNTPIGRVRSMTTFYTQKTRTANRSGKQP